MTDEIKPIPDVALAAAEDEVKFTNAETPPEDSVSEGSAPVTDEPAEGEPVADEEGSDEEGSDEETEVPEVDVVQVWADKLVAADADRYDELLGKFQAGESFDADEIAWIAEVQGHTVDEARYILDLQRAEFERQQQADTSIEDARAELGDLDALITFAREHAPTEKTQVWQEAINVAQNAASPLSQSMRDAMTMEVLRDIKSYQEQNPVQSGGKPKTLGHLASAQGPVAEPQPAPKPQAEAPEAPQMPDELTRQVRSFSHQALSTLLQDPTIDPRERAAVYAEIKRRGFIN